MKPPIVKCIANPRAHSRTSRTATAHSRLSMATSSFDGPVGPWFVQYLCDSISRMCAAAAFAPLPWPGCCGHLRVAVLCAFITFEVALPPQGMALLTLEIA